jgi:membrane-bound metal-dependent hydrolase YbcI (DUF457 family)
MKWGAHVTIAAGMAAIALGEVTRLASSRATPITIFLVFVGGVLAAQLGAILPDVIDFIVRGAGVKHRNIATHGLLSAIIPVIVSLALFWVIFVYVPAFSCINCGIAMGSGIGWISHLLLDALTPAGIPLRGKQSTWRWASYDSPSANRVLKVFGGTCLLTGILTFLDPVYPLFVPLLVALWMARWKADRVQKTDACLLALTKENAEVVATLTAIGVGTSMQAAGRRDPERNSLRRPQDRRRDRGPVAKWAQPVPRLPARNLLARAMRIASFTRKGKSIIQKKEGKKSKTLDAGKEGIHGFPSNCMGVSATVPSTENIKSM